MVRKTFLLAVAVLLLPLPAFGQLKIEGDTLTVVKRPPFKVISSVVDEPKKLSVLYYWKLPPGWEGLDTGPVLTVSKASGTGTIILQMQLVYWQEQKIERKNEVIEVHVGKAPGPDPGPDPDPGPEPTDALYKSLKTAVAADNDSVNVGKLAAFYAAAVAEAQDQRYKNAGQLMKVLQDTRRTLMPDTAILQTRQAIANHLRAVLPTSPTAELTPAVRQTAAREFTKISNYLKRLSK